MPNTLAIIPARGGSKRIPGKNSKLFEGQPIITYSIKAAKASGCFTEIMVSTDDNTIADIAKKSGASVPFLRSAASSNDHAGLVEVLLEVLEQYKKLGKTFDYVCCILPTAPFLTAQRISEGFGLIRKNEHDSVFPVVRFGYPIQRALKLKGTTASMFWPENYDKRSQDLEPAYHDCGQFYWVRPDVLGMKKRLFTDRSGYVILSEAEVQDIDTPEDWDIAELKYRMLRKK
jgi:pseudaminic acid cytidylyltransferase